MSETLTRAVPLRRAALLWAAAALVALAEILCAGLVFHPTAPAIYRDYYIDRSSDCWPHATAGNYALGTTILFTGEQFFPNKICGWFYPSDKGTWSYGSFAILRFRFPPTTVPMTLALMAGANVDKGHPTQRVEVTVNDTPLGEVQFDSREPTERDVTIPGELAGGGHIELRLAFPDARPGDEHDPNADPHLRAIRMNSVTLSPMS